MVKRVLITGMSGLIGGLLKDHLIKVGGYELTALNRRHVYGVKTYRASITDLKAIEAAFEGQDIVIHLGAFTGLNNWGSQLSVNIAGTYNVFEVSRKAGIKRIIFASSGATIHGFESINPYHQIITGHYAEVPQKFPLITHPQYRPKDLYGVSKVFGEALGRHFADAYGISVLCIRIGSVKREDRPLNVRENSVYLSYQDLCDVFQLCIDASDHIKYDVFFAVSDNKRGYRDLSHTTDVIGYEPNDSAETKLFMPD